MTNHQPSPQGQAALVYEALKAAHDELWQTYGATPRVQPLFDEIEKALDALGAAQETPRDVEARELRAWAEGRNIVCGSCGAVNEASVQWREEVIEHLKAGPIPVVVPVWTCHVCKESWTDYVAERIRDDASRAALARVPAAPTEEK